MPNKKSLDQDLRWFWALIADARDAVKNGDFSSDAIVHVDDELDTLALYTDWPMLKLRIAAARREFAEVPKVAEAG